MKALGTPLPENRSCSQMFTGLTTQFTHWVPLAKYEIGQTFDLADPAYIKAYQKAQANANVGIPTIALSANTQNQNIDDHVSVVTPNGETLEAIGNMPIGDVLTSQAGATIGHDITIAWGFGADYYTHIMFFSYYG